jgi:CubicO group peptidase (beta-lactamase class C family)
MKQSAFFLAILCSMQLAFCQDVPARLDSIVNAYTAMHKFNGSVLVMQKGTVLLNKGYGYRNVADKIQNDEKTIYQLGSITKQFTAAIILKLQQEKKLDVQDKLSKYFPAYPKGDSITIEQLLTHTSGIYNYTNDADFMANEVTNPTSREKIMALFKDKPLDFSPGTGWSYSNSGYSLLGYIIEIASKKPYEEVVRKYIFSPLQMTHSGFDFTHLKSTEKATGYFKISGSQTQPAPIADSSVSFSAGAIYSTTGDLLLWHKALLSNTVLTKAQQEKAYTPVRKNYGYGWNIDNLDGKRRVQHSGGIHGFTTNIARVPQDDVCIVLLSNASDGTLGEITTTIFNVLYNKPYTLPKEKTVLKVNEETLKQYIGEYEIRPDLHVIMSVKNGELIASPTGQPESVIYAEKEDTFFVEDKGIQIEFNRNEQKEVVGFMLHQGGANIPCKKIK